MKTWIYLIGILVILFFTNPKPYTHKSEVNKIINNEMSLNKKKDKSDDIIDGFVSLFGNSLVRMVAEEMIKVEDYGFFSITILEYEGVRYKIGIGILTKVYISDYAENQIRGLIRQKLYNKK